MGVEENKKTLQRFFEEIHNKANYTILDDIMHDDFNANPWESEKVNGKEALKQTLDYVRSLYPDYQMIIERMIAEDETVVILTRIRGAFSGGGNPNHPSAGKKIDNTVVGVYEFKDGKLISGKAIFDNLVSLHQIGALSSMEEIYQDFLQQT